MAPNGAKFKDIGISMMTGLIELYKTSYEKLEENYNEIMYVGNMFVTLLT
ncbi:hypothetical protein [Campylobacter concisus]|nr:hypothetical protein [Campylobacter concisus]